jgi:hypothetical protein
MQAVDEFIHFGCRAAADHPADFDGFGDLSLAGSITERFGDIGLQADWQLAAIDAPTAINLRVLRSDFMARSPFYYHRRRPV